MFSACTPEAHRGSSEQSIKVIFVCVFMAGRQLRVDGERIPGFSFRAEKPLSLKGNKKSAEEKRGVPYGAVIAGKIFAGQSPQGFAKGFPAVLYEAMNEVYSTIGKK